MKKPACGRKEQVVSPEQFVELIARYKDENFRDLLTVTWETGCRPQESLRVEARHVDLTSSRWVFPASESKGKIIPRAVYLTPIALEITKRLMEKHPTGPLFRNTDGKVWTSEGHSSLVGAPSTTDSAGNSLYPKVRLSNDRGATDAQVVAWIWAHTVASPNPAAQGKHVPLISSYWLSTKKGNLSWLVPIVDKHSMTYRFDVQTGIPADKAATFADDINTVHKISYSGLDLRSPRCLCDEFQLAAFAFANISICFSLVYGKVVDIFKLKSML